MYLPPFHHHLACKVRDVVVVIGFAIASMTASVAFDPQSSFSASLLLRLLADITLSMTVAGFAVAYGLELIFRTDATFIDAVIMRLLPPAVSDAWRRGFPDRNDVVRGTLILLWGWVVTLTCRALHHHIGVEVHLMLACLSGACFYVNHNNSSHPHHHPPPHHHHHHNYNDSSYDNIDDNNSNLSNFDDNSKASNYFHASGGGGGGGGGSSAGGDNKTLFHNAINATSAPVYCVFFTFVGLNMNIAVLNKVIVSAVGFFALRIAAMIVGTAAGCFWAGCPQTHISYGWMACECKDEEIVCLLLCRVFVCFCFDLILFCLC